MTIAVQGLSHLGLKVRDLDRSLAFYERVIAFKTVLDQRGGVLPGHETVLGRVGDVRVELIHDPASAPTDVDGLGWSCVCLRVDDLDASVEALRADDIEVIGPVAFPAARTAFFRDPDGNLLELIDVDL